MTIQPTGTIWNNINSPHSRLIQETLDSLIPTGHQMSGTESEALLGLCMLSVHPTGMESPHNLMGRLSNRIINYFIHRQDSRSPNKLIRQMYLLFIIEWGYRNDYLIGKWSWDWINKKEGDLKYTPKIPIEEMIKKSLSFS